ncbi:MAG: LacI family DNA-binding transcriptional regulator [Eubacteriales bacterium]|nr:LacI family DNA-binding transcriptional regulator [Eubacteriales bacterium]
MSGTGKRVTLQMIAEQAGVSVVTVSNVLSGKKKASEEMQNRIQKIADALGYQKGAGNRIGSEKFCVLIAERYVSEPNSYYMGMYRQIVQAASRREAVVALEIVDLDRELQHTPMGILPGYTMDGILIVGEMRPEFIDRIQEEYPIPVVCVDFYDVDRSMDFVITDSYRGMYKAVERLIACGHERIAYVGTIGATSSIMDRYLGYRKAMLMHGLTSLDPIPDRAEDGTGYRAVLTLPKERPTAYVCNCERTARLLIRQLEESGTHVPADVSVAAFDRMQNTSPKDIRLTVYESDEAAMAEIGVSVLWARVHKKNRPQRIHTVQGRVVDGDSVRRRETVG